MKTLVTRIIALTILSMSMGLSLANANTAKKRAAGSDPQAVQGGLRTPNQADCPYKVTSGREQQQDLTVTASQEASTANQTTTTGSTGQ
jgi:hypothetical protein